MHKQFRMALGKKLYFLLVLRERKIFKYLFSSNNMFKDNIFRFLSKDLNTCCMYYVVAGVTQ